jgi:hypothetical protein
MLFVLKGDRMAAQSGLIRGRFASKAGIKVGKDTTMEHAIRALHTLSAVIMVTAGVYIQMTFGYLLSAATQGLMGSALVLYCIVQIESCSRRRGNHSGTSER